MTESDGSLRSDGPRSRSYAIQPASVNEIGATSRSPPTNASTGLLPPRLVSIRTVLMAGSPAQYDGFASSTKASSVTSLMM